MDVTRSTQLRTRRQFATPEPDTGMGYYGEELKDAVGLASLFDPLATISITASLRNSLRRQSRR
jgi:hypothetical protein